MESAVNEIVAKRMNKAQQMRWSKVTEQPFLDVRAAMQNYTLEDAFRQRYPGFRPANDDQALSKVALSFRPHDFACSRQRPMVRLALCRARRRHQYRDKRAAHRGCWTAHPRYRKGRNGRSE